MKKFILLILRPFLGKKKYQSFFEKLYYISLYGLNYVQGDKMEDNGEKNSVKSISNYLKKEKELILFDVGANIGSYSKMMTNIFGGNARIYSFEPSKIVFESLTKEVKNSANIQCFNFGFGDAEEKKTLYFNKELTTIGSVFNRDMSHWGNDYKLDTSIEIELRKLDNFCTEKNIQHIHFLKLDVEGNEMNVFKGASDLLSSSKIDFIQFEFGVCQIDSKNFLKDYYYLLSPQYRIFRIVKDGFIELKKYNEIYEVFRTTNYLAVNRRLNNFN